MAASALLILTTFAARQLAVSAQKDCPVLVTGPNQQWTPARHLEWIPAPSDSLQTSTEAPSANRQFPGRPPGHWELSFSVQSLLSGLEIHLSSTRHLGGLLLQVNSTGWRAQRTLVGSPAGSLAVKEPPPSDQVTAADQWSSYAVSLSRPATLQLQRLYDNGTRRMWLELALPQDLPVDSASLRVTPPASERSGLAFRGGIGPEARGDWGFWKFDCSKFYYQTVKLCHLWPSWPSDVPLRFRTPHRRINPTPNLVVHVSTAGTTELYLYEAPERYYLVTLTPSELTLGRAERGVPAAREVARVCLTSRTPPSGYRLLWVSVVRGFISVGEEGAQLCVEDVMETTVDSPTAGTPRDGVTTTEGPTSAPAEVTEVTGVTIEATNVTTEQLATTTTTPRTPLISWQDGLPYSVASYGVRAPDGQGMWTVDCQPSSDPAPDEAKTDELPTRRFFAAPMDPSILEDPGLADTSPDHSSGSGSGSGSQQQPFLLATVVLAVASVVLLLVAVLLITALISQRRRWSAQLAADRHLSLVGTDVFSSPPTTNTAGENEYAEVHLYDRVRPMSVLPGESTFKPVRKQAKPVTPPETKLDDVPKFETASVPVSEDSKSVLEGSVPVSQGSVPISEDLVPVFEAMPEAQVTPKTRETSVEPLPPPPENI